MQSKCPRCGFANSSDHKLPADVFFRPWHIRGRGAVYDYVQSLGAEALEWLLALYVDDHDQLLAVDTVARGDVASCPVPFWKLIDRAHALKAAGFVLVHNHPSGDPRPSMIDLQMTRRLAYVSHELNVPLIAHYIIAGEEMILAYGI